MRCLRCKSEIDPNFKACPHCGDAVTDFTRRFTTELLDGKYEIIERIGAGGMGQVYRAVHKFLGSTRVIKVVHSQISESKDAHDRFLREARTATKVQHPNVATLHDFAALPDGAHYMVWEYIEGENLAQRLRARGTLHPRQALRIIIQALHGLEALHRAGIVHRDISPENLMVTADDTVKIIDLGVAKVEDPTETAATRTGIFVGKLRYAAPEQLGFLNEGERIDARADLFAMGMVLYELLTGRPPFEAKSPHEYVILHTREPQATETALPPEMPAHQELEGALRKALARDRANRFQTAREFAAALEAIERKLPDQRDMRTVATAIDGDETLRVTPAPIRTAADELHRETIRTDVPPPPAAATVRTDISAPAPSKRPIGPIIIVAVILLIGAAAVAAVILFWPDRTEGTDRTDGTNAAAVTAPPPAGPAKVAETAVDVLSTTSAPATIAETPTLSTTTTVAPRPPQMTTTTAAPVPTPTPTPAPAPTNTVAAADDEEASPADEDEEIPEAEEGAPPPYIEGGNRARNEDAIAYLRGEVLGTNAVAVYPGPYRQALVRELRAMGIDVRPVSNVVIRVDGRIGVVRKNGRTVFRYVPRRGGDPLRSFARALRDGF
jgi:eukaryotic-like serine/threonine-protein kinase